MNHIQMETLVSRNDVLRTAMEVCPELVLYELAGLPESKVEELLMCLSKARLERLRKVAAIVFKNKYDPSLRTGAPRYGNLPRVFSLRQVKLFFEELWRFQNRDVYDAFCLQFFYALRVGEISSVSLVPGQRLVRVENVKCRRVEYLPLIDGTEPLFRPLNCGKGYNSNYLRKYFRETCERLGDEFMFRYASSRKGNALSQYATHTLRKTAGNMLRMKSGDPYKESVYLRHNTRTIYGATSHYMNYAMDDMRDDLEAVFGELVATLVRSHYDSNI